MVIHGREKVGKSTFAAGAPNPIFIQIEDGLAGVDAQAFPLCTELAQVYQCLETLGTQDHDFKTVVIDSADWLERLIHADIMKRENKTSMNQCGGGFGGGYALATDMFFDVLRMLDVLNKERGMIVIVICHSKIVSFNDPTSEPFDRITLKLHSPKSGNGAQDVLSEYADLIGFADVEKYVRNVSDDPERRNNRATGTSKRLLYVDNSPAHLSGNRYGLHGSLPLEFSAVMEAIHSTTQEG